MNVLNYNKNCFIFLDNDYIMHIWCLIYYTLLCIFNMYFIAHIYLLHKFYDTNQSLCKDFIVQFRDVFAKKILSNKKTLRKASLCQKAFRV